MSLKTAHLLFLPASSACASDWVVVFIQSSQAGEIHLGNGGGAASRIYLARGLALWSWALRLSAR